MTKPPPGPLERYVKVLEAIAAAPEGIASRDLERALRLPKTTVARLLHGLTASGLVTQEGRGRHQIGARLVRLVGGSAPWLDIVGARILADLVEKTGETCFVVKLEGERIVSALRESPDVSVGVYVTPGHDLPPSMTATGKLLTAFQPPERQTAILNGLPRARVERLGEEFVQIRSRGYAIEDGEHVQGLFTIAVPVDAAPGAPPRHALGLTGLAERLRLRAESEFLPLMRAAAAEMAQAGAPFLRGA